MQVRFDDLGISPKVILKCATPRCLPRAADYDWAKRENVDVASFLSEVKRKRYGDKIDPLVRDWVRDARDSASLRQLCDAYKIDSEPTVLDLLIDVAKHMADSLTMSKALGVRFTGILQVDGKNAWIREWGQEPRQGVVLTLRDGLLSDVLSRKLLPSESRDYIAPMFQDFKHAFGVEPLVTCRDFSKAIESAERYEFPHTLPIGDPYHQDEIIDRILAEPEDPKEKRRGQDKKIKRMRWQLWALSRGFVGTHDPERAAFYWAEIQDRRSTWLNDSKCMRILDSLESHFTLLTNKFKLIEAGLPLVWSIGGLENKNKSVEQLMQKLGGAFHSEKNAPYLINLWTAFERTLKLTSGPLDGFSPLTVQGIPEEVDYLAAGLNSSRILERLR
jgi:hypothetical protein